MILSCVIVTRNRRDALLTTLARVREAVPYPRDEWETWVVDNASTDGSVEAVKQAFPEVRIIRTSQNEGVAARNLSLIHI